MTTLSTPSALYMATSDGFVVRVSGLTTSAGPYEDISPSSMQRPTIGTVIKMISDPHDIRRLILFGSQGILVAQDVTAPTVIWNSVNVITYYSVDVPANDFSGGTTHNTNIQISDGDEISVFAVGTWDCDPHDFAGHEPGWCICGPDGLTNQYAFSYPRIVSESPQNLLIGRVGTSGSFFPLGASGTVTATTSGILYLGINDQYNEFYYEDNSGSVQTQITINQFNLIADIQASATRLNYFGWLSKKTISGSTYVFYNWTPDYFANTYSRQVARYASNMVYGIVISPLSLGAASRIWVTAGDPTGGDAAVYESTNWGSSFLRLDQPAIGSGGGAINMSWAVPNGILGATARNLIALESVDSGTGNLSISGLNGVPKTVDNVGGPLNNQAIACFPYNANVLNAVVHDGSAWKLLTSTDGGSNWPSPSSLPSGWEAQILLGWPSSENFLLVAGTNTFGYRASPEDSWTDLWSGDDGFSAWASSNLSGWHNVIASILIGIPPQPTHSGPGFCPICFLGQLAALLLGNPVDAQTGNKYEEVTDLTLNTPAGPLAFTRTYRQDKEQDSAYQFMGMGWTHNHNISLDLDTLPDKIVVRMPNAGEAHFTNTGTNHWEGDPGSASFIDYSTGTTHYTLTATDTSTYVFDSTGILLSRSWPNHETWIYHYTSSRLSEVDGGHGRCLQFTYISDPEQFDDGMLWRVGDQNATGLDTNDPQGIYIEFTYFPQKSGGHVVLESPKALLASVRDVRTNIWTYDYFGQHVDETDTNKLDFITKRVSPEVDTTGDGIPDSYITLESLDYTFSSSTLSAITQEQGIQGTAGPLYKTDFAFQVDGQNITTETVALKVTTHKFANGLYLGSQDPAGNSNGQVPNFQYRPEQQQDANGNNTLLQWSGDGKQLQQVVDAQGNQTHFHYNSGGASDGTLDYSIDALGRKTQYTYGDTTNNPRLPTIVKVYDTDGTTVLRWQTFAYDTSGRTTDEQTLDPASPDPSHPIVIAETTRSYYNSGNGDGLLYQVVQKDQINHANNVTTTYFYDEAGRVIQTNQSLTFGSCTSSYTVYDNAGNVVASICNYELPTDQDAPKTADDARKLYRVATPDTNRVSTYTYDTLGRRILVTTNDGAVIEIKDEEGDVIGIEDNTIYRVSTLTVYDALDRVIRTISNYVAEPRITKPYTTSREAFQHGVDNNQNLITDTAYNERGMVRSQTDVLGNVTLFGYDDAGRLIKTIQSASQPSYNNSYTGGDPTLARYLSSDAPDLDLIIRSDYDPVGNLVQSVDALGNVSFTIYDALNRPVKTVRSASVPSYDILSDPTLSNYFFSTNADVDLVETTEYDSLGRVIRTQDAMGSYTLFGYDAMGRQVKTVRAASQPSYDLTLDPSLSFYYASDVPDQDIITQTVYDTAGRVLYTADVLNRKTWSAYDGLNRVVRTVANAVGAATDGGAQDPRSSNYNPVVNFSDRDLISQTSYDTDGFVLYTEDSLGRRTWFAYDTLGRQIRTIANAVGRATDSTTNPASPSYRFSASPDEDILTQTVYDAQGRVAVTIDPAGNETHYIYDKLGRRIQTIVNYFLGSFNPAYPDRDLVTTTAYDIAGRLIATTDPRGTQTTFTYDRAGRRLTTTQAVGTSLATTSYTCYDKGSRVLRTIANYRPKPTDPSPDERDTAGNWLFNPKVHGRANDTNLISLFIQDKLGRQIASSDPLGNIVTTAYYKDGTVESVTDQLTVVTKYRYDRTRRRTIVVQSYQGAGLTDPGLWYWDTTNSLWKDGYGKGINVITANGNTTSGSAVVTNLDNTARLRVGMTVSGTGIPGDTNILSIDSTTQVTLSHNATATGTGETLTFGVPTNDINIVVQVQYDKSGRVLNQRDPRGNLTGYTYDLLSRRTSLTDPLNHVWSTDYSNLNFGATRTVLTDPLSNQTYQDTDKLGRLTGIVYNDADTPDVAFTYNKIGNRLAMNEVASGSPVRNTLYNYDAMRRLTSVGYDTDGSGIVDQTVSYTYDAGGLRTQLEMPDGKTVTYQYDTKGRLISLSDWDSQLTHYAYDQVGQLVGITRPNGMQSSYRYDPAGRLALLRHFAGSKLLGQFAYTVNARGNRVRAYEAVATANTGATTYAYNDPSIDYYIGTWTDSAPFKVSSNFSAALHLAFAGMGEVTLKMGVGPDHSIYDVYVDGDLWQSIDGYAVSASDVTLTISMPGEGPHLLDIRNRHEKNLQSSEYKIRFESFAAPSTTRQFDLQTLEYAYDALSRLISADTYSGSNVHNTPSQHYAYTYDVAGNRTQQIAPSGTTSYSYDAANRINSAGFAFDDAGRMTSDGTNSYGWDNANRLLSMGLSNYLYNGLGYRVQQTVGMNIIQYLLDLGVSLPQILSATTAFGMVRYIHSSTGIHEQQNMDNSWHWMVQDGLGSVRGISDAGSTSQGSAVFSPYGELLASSGTLPNFGFTGEMVDANTLVYLRARYYNPTLGAFFSPDPAESPNIYQYAASNPVNLNDPSGLFHNIKTDGNWTTGVIDKEDTLFCIGRGIGLADTLLGDFARQIHDLPPNKRLGVINDDLTLNYGDGNNQLFIPASVLKNPLYYDSSKCLHATPMGSRGPFLTPCGQVLIRPQDRRATPIPDETPMIPTTLPIYAGTRYGFTVSQGSFGMDFSIDSLCSDDSGQSGFYFNVSKTRSGSMLGVDVYQGFVSGSGTFPRPGDFTFSGGAGYGTPIVDPIFSFLGSISVNPVDPSQIQIFIGMSGNLDFTSPGLPSITGSIGSSVFLGFNPNKLDRDAFLASVPDSICQQVNIATNAVLAFNPDGSFASLPGIQEGTRLLNGLKCPFSKIKTQASLCIS